MKLLVGLETGQTENSPAGLAKDPGSQDEGLARV